MSATPRYPPVDGSVTVLPGLSDFHAQYNPHLPWVLYPSSGASVSSISFLELSKATHRVAHFLRPLGNGPRDVVAVLIHCDTILYVTALIGIARAGLVPLPISTRNSPEAVANLLVKSSCRRVLTQPSLKHLLSSVEKDYATEGIPLQVDDLPNIYDVYPTLGTNDDNPQTMDDSPYPALPAHKDDDMAMYIHSSGSTGFPKPIPLTQKIIHQWIEYPMFSGTRDNGLIWAAMALPAFHSMGILTQLLSPLVTAQPIALYAPQSPKPPVVPSPQNILDTMRICGCNTIMTVPSFIEIWAESEETMKYFSSLKIVLFGGGPLSVENGNKIIAAGVKMVSAYGCTEVGPVVDMFDLFEGTRNNSDPNARTADDWQWIRISSLTKPRWVSQGDGQYELQFLTCESHQPSVENLPDVPGYATSDLWEPHPIKTGLWKIVGRKDDVIVLGSGEKIVPIPQERLIASHPWIADVVMFGRARPQAGILIEPVPEHAFDPKDEEAASKFLDGIWSYVEEANEKAPTFARLFREMVIICDPAKPLPHSVKGTVVRKLALELYGEAIEHLYRAYESSTPKEVSCPNAWSLDEIESWLLSLTASVNHGQPLQATVDVFEQGFDSLHATFIRNHIFNALQASTDTEIRDAAKHVDRNVVYANPTIQKLAAFTYSVVSSKGSEHQSTNQTRFIDGFVTKYCADLPVASQLPVVPLNDIVVILTGSTGSLGSYILASLLVDPRVLKVYAFNRPSSASSNRQLASFEDRGLPTDLLKGSKYVPVTGDFNAEHFGLNEDVFTELKSSVTHVVHNAWRVDFNLSLDSFESQIAGTRKLVDFCSALNRPVRLLFTSSVGVAHSWPSRLGDVPESPLSNPEFASDSGYSASKYVVEQLLAKVHENGFEATSLRVGQVCGSAGSGAWNVTDWLPNLVKSSLAIGSFPNLEEPVSWIPVDAVADSIRDLLFSPERLPPLLNVVHPRPVPWKHILDGICKDLHVPPNILPLKEWIEKLEIRSNNATAQDLENIPGIKLVGFFRTLLATGESGGFPSFETTKLQSFSRTMHDLGPIGTAHATMWISYWRKKGFLSAQK